MINNNDNNKSHNFYTIVRTIIPDMEITKILMKYTYFKVTMFGH